MTDPATTPEAVREIRKCLRRSTYRNLHALITLYGVPKTHRHGAYILLRKALRDARPLREEQPAATPPEGGATNG